MTAVAFVATVDDVTRFRGAHQVGRSIAAVALARRLAGILYAMWRDGTDYRAPRPAAPAVA